MSIALIIGAVIGFAVVGAGLWYIVKGKPPNVRCAFDRNEPGPQGTYGQWWWEIYKCSDGGERRELVAGPRG